MPPLSSPLHLQPRSFNERPPASKVCHPLHRSLLAAHRLGGIKRFFKGLGVIWVTVLTEKGGLFFWYAVLKALWGSYAGSKSTSTAHSPQTPRTQLDFQGFAGPNSKFSLYPSLSNKYHSRLSNLYGLA